MYVHRRRKRDPIVDGAESLTDLQKGTSDGARTTLIYAAHEVKLWSCVVSESVVEYVVRAGNGVDRHRERDPVG